MQPVFTGWDHQPPEGENLEGPGEELNARRETARYLADMAKQWADRGGIVWAGSGNPCYCGAFDFLHRHQEKGPAGEEPTVTQCSPQEDNSFWED
eukprot:10029885-Heterocapsa_arctica.AAC.1